NRCLASGEGSSCPSSRRVAAGAAIAALPSARSKAIMFALVIFSACSSVISGNNRRRESGSGGEVDRRDQDCDEVPPTKEPFRLHPGALRRVLALPERCSSLHRRSPRRGCLPHRRGAGQESEHLVIDGGALLPGPRLRGLPGAPAGR